MASENIRKELRKLGIILEGCQASPQSETKQKHAANRRINPVHKCACSGEECRHLLEDPFHSFLDVLVNVLRNSPRGSPSIPPPPPPLAWVRFSKTVQEGGGQKGPVRRRGEAQRLSLWVGIKKGGTATQTGATRRGATSRGCQVHTNRGGATARGGAGDAGKEVRYHVKRGSSHTAKFVW